MAGKMGCCNLDALLSSLNVPVRKKIRQVVERKKEPKYVYGLISEFLSEQGKGLRPALCLLTCKAVGGNGRNALPAAAAIEMFHNFTLIHDDIEDCSLMRRGKPTLHVKYGIPLALNAGDGLFMMVWEMVRTIRGPFREKAEKALLSAFTEVLEGQAIELGWYLENKWDVDENDYVRMVSGKTGALMGVSCEVGALLGGAPKRVCKEMFWFGRELGIGFQIMDDVLNLTGDEKKYRKEIGGDIAEGKRTLIMIWAFRTLPKQKKERLMFLLGKKTKRPEDIKEAVGLIAESEGLAKAKEYAREVIERAKGRLCVLPDSRFKRALEALADYVLSRDR